MYDKHYDTLLKRDSNLKYISHEITERMKTHPNVYFLTPLSKSNYIYADILPYSENKIKSNIPIYIVQGHLNRRNWNLLAKILQNNYSHDFKIKLVGRGRLPSKLQSYKNKIILKNHCHNFVDFHKQFLDAYCLLPLISKNSHTHYYTNKLTSSISYVRGYQLKCLIDKDLQSIYNLDNVEIYNDVNDIVNKFENTLNDFCNYQC